MPKKETAQADMTEAQVENYLFEFVKELLKKAELTQEDGSVDEVYAKNLALELQKTIGFMVMDELNTQDLEEYTKMLYETKAKPAELANFLNQHIENFEDKRNKVMEDFATRILERTAQMRQFL